MASVKIEFTKLPKKLQIAAKGIGQDPGIVDYYECRKKEDLFELASKFPFETTVIANNANATKSVDGWFMVGLAFPNRLEREDADKKRAGGFNKPVMAFTYLTEADKRLYSEDIKKEVGRRKKLWNETKAGFRNLLRP